MGKGKPAPTLDASALTNISLAPLGVKFILLERNGKKSGLGLLCTFLFHSLV